MSWWLVMRLFIIYSFSFLLSSSLAIFNLPLKLFKGVAQCKNPIHSNVIETISDNSMLFLLMMNSTQSFDCFSQISWVHRKILERKKEKVFFSQLPSASLNIAHSSKWWKLLTLRYFFFSRLNEENDRVNREVKSMAIDLYFSRSM